MTPRQTAIRNTLTIIGSGLVTGFLVTMAFQYLTVAQIGVIAILGVLVFLIKLVYEIELSKAEHLEYLNKKG